MATFSLTRGVAWQAQYFVTGGRKSKIIKVLENGCTSRTFVTRPPKDRDFPPRGVLGKGSVRKSRISLIHVEHAAVFTFFRGITNRQSEQLLRPGFWSSICRESMTFIGT